MKESTPVAVLYRDRHVAVAVKPVGIPAQPDSSGDTDMTALLAESLGVSSVYPVHRLDRPTGGVTVYALTKEAAARLSDAFQKKTAEKTYLAVTDGVPLLPSAELCDYLYHDTRKNRTFVSATPRKGAKEAILRYTVSAIAPLPPRGVSVLSLAPLPTELPSTPRMAALAEVTLLTGRTHQVRAQMAAKGTPLLGDGKYGSRENRTTAALWAYRLSFPHPVSGEHLTFEAPPPPRFPWSLFPTFAKTSPTDGE